MEMQSTFSPLVSRVRMPIGSSNSFSQKSFFFSSFTYSAKSDMWFSEAATKVCNVMSRAITVVSVHTKISSLKRGCVLWL